MELKNYDFHGVEINGFVSRAVKPEFFNCNQKMKKTNAWMNQSQEGKMMKKKSNNNRKWKSPTASNGKSNGRIQKIWDNFPRSLFCEPASSINGQPVHHTNVSVDQGSILSLLR